MKRILFLSFVLVTSSMLHAHASDIPAVVIEMVNDLGVSEKQKAENVGKLLTCAYRGTKRIKITLSKGTVKYDAEYNNCRENGTIRDGIYEMVFVDGELVKSSEKRSINGELFDAAKDGDITRLRALIRSKADVNYTESIPRTEGGEMHEWTPLMSAVMVGSADSVDALVKAGAWVNYLNSEAVNALWLAANKGHLGIVKYLIAHGAYRDNQGVNNITPVMVAAINGHYEVVKYLIDARAKINLQHNDGDTALMFAVAKGHREIVDLLLAAGADVNVQSKSGITALIIATVEGNEEIVKKLLDKKADATLKTDGGKTALDIATAKGQVRIMELLKQAHGK